MPCFSRNRATFGRNWRGPDRYALSFHRKLRGKLHVKNLRNRYVRPRDRVAGLPATPLSLCGGGHRVGFHAPENPAALLIRLVRPDAAAAGVAEGRIRSGAAGGAGGIAGAVQFHRLPLSALDPPCPAGPPDGHHAGDDRFRAAAGVAVRRGGGISVAEHGGRMGRAAWAIAAIADRHPAGHSRVAGALAGRCAQLSVAVPSRPGAQAGGGDGCARAAQHGGALSASGDAVRGRAWLAGGADPRRPRRRGRGDAVPHARGIARRLCRFHRRDGCAARPQDAAGAGAVDNADAVPPARRPDGADPGRACPFDRGGGAGADGKPLRGGLRGAGLGRGVRRGGGGASGDAGDEHHGAPGAGCRDGRDRAPSGGAWRVQRIRGAGFRARRGEWEIVVSEVHATADAACPSGASGRRGFVLVGARHRRDHRQSLAPRLFLQCRFVVRSADPRSAAL